MHGKGLDLPCNLSLIRPSELVNTGTILSADFQDGPLVQSDILMIHHKYMSNASMSLSCGSGMHEHGLRRSHYLALARLFYGRIDRSSPASISRIMQLSNEGEFSSHVV
jgi:hypothetical protein